MKAKMLFSLALALVSSAQADLRLEATGGPFYARFERGLIHTDGQWAAIAFYRLPDCVPARFNLLDFFDPAALACPSFVAGFEVWRNGPGTGDQAPIQSRLQNVALMPIWFVSWAELQAAIADDVVTLDELAALPSLRRGEAMFYTETLHPMQGAQQTKTTVVASGLLEDGRSFTYQITETRGTLQHIKIEFE